MKTVENRYTEDTGQPVPKVKHPYISWLKCHTIFPTDDRELVERLTEVSRIWPTYLVKNGVVPNEVDLKFDFLYRLDLEGIHIYIAVYSCKGKVESFITHNDQSATEHFHAVSEGKHVSLPDLANFQKYLMELMGQERLKL